MLEKKLLNCRDKQLATFPIVSNYKLLNKLSSTAIFLLYEATFIPLSRTSLSKPSFTRFSDPVRVAIFVEIAGSNCSHNCSNFLNVTEKTIPKSTLSLHFKALREAGLIRGERRGVQMHNIPAAQKSTSAFRIDCGDRCLLIAFSPNGNRRLSRRENVYLPTALSRYKLIYIYLCTPLLQRN